MKKIIFKFLMLILPLFGFSQELIIYPNPIINEVIIKSNVDSLKINYITIKDVQNKKVLKTKVDAKNTVSLYLETLSSGIYLVEIQTVRLDNKLMKEETIVKRLIKK